MNIRSSPHSCLGVKDKMMWCYNQIKYDGFKSHWLSWGLSALPLWFHYIFWWPQVLRTSQGLAEGRGAGVTIVYLCLRCLPVDEVLTCPVCQRGSSLETLLFCWSLTRSSLQVASQVAIGQSLCEYLDQSCQQISQITKSPFMFCSSPRSLFQSLMRTFAKAMTSSSVQCFLILFTDIPILVS